jgi:predicted transcriptional regulator of viral defense system
MATPAATHEGAPDWDALFSVAQAYSGYFTTAQAAGADYSLPLLHKYLANGRVIRVRRGIHRLVHFPASEHEDLVVLWLWADQAGVFSHETALALHEANVSPELVRQAIRQARRRGLISEKDGGVLQGHGTSGE